MSKVLTFVTAGASATLLQVAAQIVAKATNNAVRTTTAPQAERQAVIITDGTQTPAGVIASVVRAPAKPSAAYSGVKTAVVRAVLPRRSADQLPLRDALDVYPSAGIVAEAEVHEATKAFQQAAAAAVAVAKEQQGKRVTLVVKQASKYAQLNETFLNTATTVCESAGMTVEVLSTGRAATELVMFPERLGVVLTNDSPNCENVQYAFAGVVGGAHSTFISPKGVSIAGGHSQKSVALAIAHELRQMGLTAEASKVEAAAEKSPLNVAAAL